MAFALAIGTCRVFGPTKLMRAANYPATISLHRVHATPEILNLLDAIRHEGRDGYDHLLSDTAFEEIVVKGSSVVADHRLRLRNALWPRTDRLLIEISSMRFFAAEGGRAVVGPLAWRDMQKHSDALEKAIGTGKIAALRPDDFERRKLSRAELIADMRRITKQAEGRAITWVCHAIPPDPSPEYDHVRSLRTTLAKVVEAGAKATGGGFFDPSQVVADLGQSRAFRQRGRDTTHFTREALSVLAGEYSRVLGLKPRMPRAKHARGPQEREARALAGA